MSLGVDIEFKSWTSMIQATSTKTTVMYDIGNKSMYL